MYNWLTFWYIKVDDCISQERHNVTFLFQCLDWEVELVIVIGKEAKNVQVLYFHINKLYL